MDDLWEYVPILARKVWNEKDLEHYPSDFHEVGGVNFLNDEKTILIDNVLCKDLPFDNFWINSLGGFLLTLPPLLVEYETSDE